MLSSPEDRHGPRPARALRAVCTHQIPAIGHPRPHHHHGSRADALALASRRQPAAPARRRLPGRSSPGSGVTETATMSVARCSTRWPTRFGTTTTRTEPGKIACSFSAIKMPTIPRPTSSTTTGSPASSGSIGRTTGTCSMSPRRHGAGTPDAPSSGAGPASGHRTATGMRRSRRTHSPWRPFPSSGRG